MQGMHFCTGTKLVSTFVKLFTQGLDVLKKFHQTISGKRLLFSTALRACLEQSTWFWFGSRFCCPFVKEVLCVEVNLLTVDCLLTAACYKKNCSGNSQVSLHSFIEKTSSWSVRFLQLSNIFSVLLVKLNKSCLIVCRDIQKIQRVFSNV